MSKELYKVLKKERKKGGKIEKVGADTLRKMVQEGRSVTDEQKENLSKSKEATFNDLPVKKKGIFTFNFFFFAV